MDTLKDNMEAWTKVKKFFHLRSSPTTALMDITQKTS